MSDIQQARTALTTRILEGDGQLPSSGRQAAFHNRGVRGPAGALVDKVARQAWRVRDEDFAAAQATGLNEDQVFEMVVCAAIGQATRQYEAALAALDAATGTE